MRFDTGSNCLKSIGCTEAESRINNINSNFNNSNKYCEAVTIMQKDIIVDKMFKILSIESIENPKNAKDLYEMLENRGPFLGRGKLGIESYMPNTAKHLKSVAESTHIFGWDSKNYINDPQAPQHATIIIGVEVQETPDKSRVYFLDPLQPLDPKDKHMQVYSVSFSKYMQQTKDIYFLKNYGLTEEVRNLENKTKKTSPFSSGFFAKDKNEVIISQANTNQPPSNTQFSNVNDLYSCLMEQKKEFKLMNF